MKKRTILWAGLWLAAMAGSASAGDGHWSYRASAGMGHDNNVLRETANRDSGAFIPLAGYVDYRTVLSPKARLAVGARATGDKYTDANNNGNEFLADIDFHYDRRLTGGKRGFVRVHSLDLQVMGRVQQRNTNYLSRRLGEEIAAPGDNGPVLLTDRYDSRKAQGAVGLTYRLFRHTRLEGIFEATRRNYENDYADAPTVDPLDYTNRNVKLLLTHELNEDLEVSAGFKNSHTDYDAWRARDLNGNKVDGVYQEFRYLTWEAELSYRPDPKLVLSCDVHQRDRTDPFQGYYDYSQWGVGPRVRYRVTPKLDVDLHYSHIHRTYERARVGFDPARPLRDDTEDRLAFRARYEVSTHGRVFLRVRYIDNQEADPLYTYDRQIVSSGYQVSY